MTQDEMKQAVAEAALEYIRPHLEDDTVLGIGTGSTANLFIDALATVKGLLNATVAIVDEESADAILLTGTLLSIDKDSFEMVAGGVTYVVWFDEDVKTVRIGETGGKLTSELIDPEDLEVGVVIEVHGVTGADSSVNANALVVIG